jgi:hypothetical protein
MITRKKKKVYSRRTAAVITKERAPQEKENTTDAA